MKLSLDFVFLISASITGAFAAGHVARSTKCDINQAYSILESLSTGASFCSSYIHVSGVSTKTKTTTLTVTGECTTTTKTKTVHATFTSTVYGATTTLPQLTLTEYSSSVLIPSPSVNKRSDASAAPANQPATPTALTSCASETISGACSSLVCTTITTTTKVTVTATKTQKCTKTTTLAKTKTDHTTTSTIPFLVSPPPIILSSSGVLTTTVPAACASGPYDTSGNDVGNEVIPVGYPYFPQTAVECCVICFTQENCIASAVIYGDDADTQLEECDMLIHVNGTQAGATSLCPLGIQDYGFTTKDPAGLVYPGPCGI